MLCLTSSVSSSRVALVCAESGEIRRTNQSSLHNGAHLGLLSEEKCVWPQRLNWTGYPSQVNYHWKLRSDPHCPLIWPLLSFNMFYMFSDSLDTWLSFHSTALSYFCRIRQGSPVVTTVWTLESTSSHLALGWPSQQVAVWPTLGAASCTGIRPTALHVEMERVSIVFDAIYNPGKRCEEEGSWN